MSCFRVIYPSFFIFKASHATDPYGDCASLPVFFLRPLYCLPYFRENKAS